MTALGTAWAVDWMARTATAISARRIDLIELDRAIGDGDHGENMDRGFAAVTSAIDGAATVSDVLMAAAKCLISTVGGAAGPLYGTALLRAATAVRDREELSPGDVVTLLEAALGGIQHRGHAVAEDKTMVDAWLPAVDAAREAAATGATPAEVLRAAADAAAEGAAATEPLVARKGRASYLGERSVGHRDPGAESSAILLRAAADAGAAA